MTALFAVGFVIGYVALVGVIVFLLELLMPLVIQAANGTRRMFRRMWNWVKSKWPGGSPAPTATPTINTVGQQGAPLSAEVAATVAQHDAAVATPTVEPKAPEKPATPKPAKKAGLAGGFKNLELPPEGAEGAVA